MESASLRPKRGGYASGDEDDIAGVTVRDLGPMPFQFIRPSSDEERSTRRRFAAGLLRKSVATAKPQAHVCQAQMRDVQPRTSPAAQLYPKRRQPTLGADCVKTDRLAQELPGPMNWWGVEAQGLNPRLSSPLSLDDAVHG